MDRCFNKTWIALIGAVAFPLAALLYLAGLPGGGRKSLLAILLQVTLVGASVVLFGIFLAKMVEQLNARRVRSWLNRPRGASGSPSSRTGSAPTSWLVSTASCPTSPRRPRRTPDRRLTARTRPGRVPPHVATPAAERSCLPLLICTTNNQVVLVADGGRNARTGEPKDGLRTPAWRGFDGRGWFMDEYPAGPASPGPWRLPLSVVIPVYNGGNDFERCLQGLRVVLAGRFRERRRRRRFDRRLRRPGRPFWGPGAPARPAARARRRAERRRPGREPSAHLLPRCRRRRPPGDDRAGAAAGSRRTPTSRASSARTTTGPPPRAGSASSGTCCTTSSTRPGTSSPTSAPRGRSGPGAASSSARRSSAWADSTRCATTGRRSRTSS